MSTQPSLFETPDRRTFRKPRMVSREAAPSEESRDSMNSRVLAFLISKGVAGSTSKVISKALGIPQCTLSWRFKDLSELGAIFYDANRTKNKCHFWVAGVRQ